MALTSVTSRISRILRSAPGKAQWIVGANGIGKSMCLQFARELGNPSTKYLYLSMGKHSKSLEEWRDLARSLDIDQLGPKFDSAVVCIDDVDLFKDASSPVRQALREFYEIECKEWFRRREPKGLVLCGDQPLSDEFRDLEVHDVTPGPDDYPRDTLAVLKSLDAHRMFDAREIEALATKTRGSPILIEMLLMKQRVLGRRVV